MVAPIIAAAGIGAASGLLGGAYSNYANRREADKERARQEEFAKMGIQWRVQDAKAAGIHPLAALGMSGASSTPITIGDSLGPAMASAGQNISRAVEATMTEEQGRMSRLNEDLLRAKINQTEMETYIMGANFGEKESQKNASNGVGAVRPETLQFIPGQSPKQGDIELTPKKINTSSLGDRGTSAGVQPFLDQYQMSDVKFKLPNAEMLESLSELPATTIAGIALYNWDEMSPGERAVLRQKAAKFIERNDPVLPYFDKADDWLRRWAARLLGKSTYKPNPRHNRGR